MDDIVTLDRITLVLDYRCNLDCPYCPLHNLEYLKKPMSRMEWRLAIEKVLDFVSADVPIFLSGGEPTLDFDLLDYVISILSKNKRQIILVTNGTLLDEDKIRSLSKYKLKGLQITFHFFDIIDNELLLRKKLYRVIFLLSLYKSLSSGLSVLSLNFSTRKDLSILKILEEYAHRGFLHGVDLLELSLLNERVTLSDYEKYIQHLKKYTEVEISRYGLGIDAEIRELVITPDGFIIPAETIYPMIIKDQAKQKLFKNILEADIADILKLENWNRLIESLKRWEATA